MASTSAINKWIEELVASILPPSPAEIRQTPRRALDSFRRRLRHHTFGRTNQFDVSDQLDGLEEKFQVLNHDDLSDALYQRRLQLRGHYERWIPDVLDLLLRLSDDPVGNTKLTDISGVPFSTEAPALLKWADIEADDPIDRRDPVWQVPNFSDLSSDEDGIEVSTATTSPANVKHRQQEAVGSNEWQQGQVLEDPDLEAASHILKLLHISAKGSSTTIAEVALLRQILLMVQGYPSTLFDTRSECVQLDRQSKLQSISTQTLQALIDQLQPVRHNLKTIRGWLRQDSFIPYVQVIKQSAEELIQEYISSVCALEEHMLHPKSLQVASCLYIVTQIKKLGIPLAVLAKWVRQVEDVDSITKLDVLYDMIGECHFTDDYTGSKVMLPIFVKAFDKYMKPVETWLNEGVLVPESEPFFVHSKGITSTANVLWHDWFELDLNGPGRAPSFLKNFSQEIFACGKTVAFINRITSNHKYCPIHQTEAESFRDRVQSLISDSAIPFPAAFPHLLHNHFSSILAASTMELRHLLETKCGMNRTLEALEHIYLRKHGVLLDTIETRIFTRIDKCMDNWNDRFLVTDMLEDVYAGTNCIAIESITVHSVHTSSQSMESRRCSVRILGALAIDYVLPWPVANVISRVSLITYRRVALHLLQIRRVKYVLERTAYIQVQSIPISDKPKDQLLARSTTFMLLQFANTLYDHFTTGIALPMTTEMRNDLRTASTVDAMIAVHETYISNLDFACLTSKPLKMLRETLIGLLDMCIRFSDLVSSCSADDKSGGRRHRRGSDDSETGSFMSAQSQRRRNRRNNTTTNADSEYSEDDDDYFVDKGEGYSSFIVLDEDTDVVQEIKKLQVQFKRQLDFFVAGLRGVGRGSGTVEAFEILADRLDWKSGL